MILKGIQVEGWACFSNRVEVGPFDERINVLYSSNGTGKSTLSKILTRGLVENHGVGGADAQSLRPWGRPLTPKVTIEFAHGGVAYRLRKRFLDKPSALLERREGAGWVRLAEDESADERMRELLRADAPGAGLTNFKHWGMMQVLWAPQDLQSLPPLSGDVLSDIRSSLGVHVSSPLGMELVERLEKVYLLVFTPTGRLRSGSGEASVIRLRREHADAAAATQRAQAELTALEGRRNRIKELRARYESLHDRAERVSTDLRDARKLLGEYEQLVSQKTEREQRRRAAQSEHSRIKQLVEASQECVQAIVRAEEELRFVDQEFPRACEVVESRRQDHKLAEANMEQALANQASVWVSNELAKLGRRFTDLLQSRCNLGRRVGETNQATLDFNRLREALVSLRAPTREQLLEIRKQIRARDEAKLRLESSLIVLEVEPIADTSVVVISGDQTGPMRVTAGDSVRVAGSPAVEIEIASFGRVRASGPAGSAAQYRQLFEEAVSRLEQLTAPFGLNDETRLEELTTKAETLKRELQSAQSRQDGLLNGKTVDELKSEQTQINAELEQILQKQPSWLDSLPDVTWFEEEARRAQKDSEGQVRAAQEALTSAQLALSTATSDRLDLQKRCDRCKAEIQDQGRRLSILKADGKSDVERRKELNDAAMEWDAQRAAIEKLDEALAAYAQNPAVRVLALESDGNSATHERDIARDRLRDEEAAVREVSSTALYSVLTEASEKEETLKVDLASEEVRTEGLKLLRETVRESRSEAIAAIPEHVAETASSILQRIVGAQFRTVCLSEDLAVSGVSPRSLTGTVPLADLSGGEKEQVAFAVRLALAKQLACSERQLLVLDDSLAATDSARFGRILEILAEAADQLQILVLTCHPERYASLAGASFYNFEQTLRSQAVTAA